MRKIFKLLLLFMLAVTFVSCKDKKDVVIFGETEWYKPWLWSKYEPIIMERTFELEFNEDAKLWLKDTPLKFELRTIDDAPVEDIKLYVNGELCENNVFTVSVDDVELKMGIELDDNIKEGNYNYIIKYLGSDDNVKLDVVSFESFGYDNSIQVKKKIVKNPVMVATISSAVLFMILCLLWLFVSRIIIWRATSFSTVYIDYNDGMGPKRIRMSGKYQLVCTNNNKAKDSLLSWIFKGSRQYEFNDFWTHDVVMYDGSRRNNIRVQGLKDFCLIGESIRKERFEIENDKGDKVIIETT